METLNITILNPKAKKLLKDLADRNFIEIKDDGSKELKKLLDKIRNNSQEEISMEEITKEVEIVRKARYEKEKSSN
ncbi:hypothetical protein [Aequorivita lipolytica]|uniref:Uncharacterized protein n=1 Tax=Aequorivita lipolytica TaxID=153267 RepID=A0A5C6YMN9_9FLAO|nr:hypothetical protein [Aequorivita lipolytica]TXD68532.1 hypothetical protein ESV24_11505 [Aequorivita lipolytica]SRX53323.1 hypothetical protein AEQU2_02553 [Aequorivita lipolytica]